MTLADRLLEATWYHPTEPDSVSSMLRSLLQWARNVPQEYREYDGPVHSFAREKAFIIPELEGMKPFTSSLNDEQIAKLRRVINVARRMAVRLFLNQCNNGVKADTGMEAVRRIIRVLGKLKELVEIDWSDLITIAEQYADTAEMADAAYQKWRSIIMSINPRTVPLTVKVLPTNFFKPAPWRTELRDYQRRTAVDHHGASTADIAKLRNHIKTLRKTGSLSDAAKVGKDHIRWLIPHTLKTCLHNSKALSQYADLVSATQAVQSFEKRLSGMSMMMMRKYEELLKHGPTRTATAQFMKQVSKRTTDDAV